MNDDSGDSVSRQDLLGMTANIVAAYVSRNDVPSNTVPGVIDTVYASLSGLGSASTGRDAHGKPAVPIKRSVTPDYIVCLEDGKKLKMLKRYLRTTHSMNPEEYRAKWGLPADYPMVAPNYAKLRSDFAKAIGLGRKPGRRK